MPGLPTRGVGGALAGMGVVLGAVLPPAASPALGCPGGDAMLLLADGFTRTAVTCLSAAVTTLAPLFRSVTLPAGFPRTSLAPFFGFTWPADAPPGLYTFVLALTLPGAFAAGEARLVTLSLREVTLAPGATP